MRGRDVPIITFFNKLERESREPLDSWIAILMTLKLPHSHATFPGHGGCERTGVDFLERWGAA
jgi:peptide subunit release factor RF-3